MDWNDFYKALKEARYQSVYLFTGPEEYTKKEALAALKKAILPVGLEQLNETTLENCSAQEIIDSAETFPVMCERRIVVVRDWAALTGKGKADDKDVERMRAWLKNPPDSCIVVFYMTVDLDGRKSLPKDLKKMNCEVVFYYLSGALLQKWCNQQLRPFSKKISADAVNEMSLMAGQDLTSLSGELNKLAAYTQDAPEITIEDVRALVSPNPDYMVFMILDHLLAGRLAEATQVVNAEFQGRSNCVGLIAMFAKQLRIDAHIKYAMEARADLSEVTQALELNPYRVKNITRQIQHIPADVLQMHFQDCVDANYQIVSGLSNDRAGLNDLMLKIIHRAHATKSAQRSSNR